MKVTGIIAEYNPFHKGHQYQIDTLRAQHSSEEPTCHRQDHYVIVAMSGDFVQRGTPALMSKYERARMALLQGADLVLELPACFATASAETFARGGVLLFATTGLTDSLCFGAESDHLAQLQELASLLCEEPDWYRDALLSYIKEGYSFPAARVKALSEVSVPSKPGTGTDLPRARSYASLLESPNNILAVEYLKSIRTLNLSMKPLLIQRTGGDYHNKNIHTPFPSATAIRSLLLKTSTTSNNTSGLPADAPIISDSTLGFLPQELISALPQTSYNIMADYMKNSSFLWENDFSLLLHHALLRETPESLLKYADMTPALANRLIQQRNQFLSWSDFCEVCHTKEITYSRISRILTHLLLGIRQQDLTTYETLPYLRVLGFRQDAAPLLTELKEKAKAPLITSPSAGEKLLSEDGLSMLHTDIYASNLYRSVLTHKCGHTFPNEYQRKLLIV